MERASTYNLFHYNPGLKERARERRGKMTPAEASLWKLALSKKQTGYVFNRQRPVLNYIADFMYRPLLLIIEIDGNSHLGAEAQARDRIRQGALEQVGFRVLRFKESDVLKKLDGVRNTISYAIQCLQKE